MEMYRQAGVRFQNLMVYGHRNVDEGRKTFNKSIQYHTRPD